ncbi:TonB-dependent copper receptor [Xanthomonadaceae bacterium JHOS43]|nr:TonB-dependent copper receptor [Xanthomonadaceae bacterium JHOS43]
MLALASTDSIEAERRALDAIIVTAQAPADGVEWQTDPKLPRQPVPASDGADYLKTIPGFTAIRNGGSNGDPVLRGMFGSRLNLLSNDGSMPGACPARMDNPMSYMAPETFDRLVVVKGPQTVLWGPGASAGTVRFERDAARYDAAGARATGSVLTGSNGRRDLVLDADAGFSQGYVRMSGNTSEADDYRAGDGSRVPSLWDKWNADAAFGWTPDEDTLLEIGMGRGDGEARYAGRGMDGSMFERDSRSLRFEKSGFDGALQRIEASAYRNHVDHLMDNYSLRDPNPMSPMPMPMGANVDRLTQGGRAAVGFGWAHWQLTAGVDAQNSRHRSRSAMGRGAHVNKPWEIDAELRHRGAFAEIAFETGTPSRWIAGLRRDRASATDLRAGGGMGGMHADPKMDMGDMGPSTSGQSRRENLSSGFLRYEWQGNEGFGVFAGVGHVSRMPDYWELFSPDHGPMGSINAFDGIEPERTTQLDAGMSFRSRRLDAWINAYVGRIDDYILFTYSAGGMMGNSSHADNVDAGIHGVEAGVEYRPLTGLKLGATLAQAHGKNRDADMPLPQMPPLELRMSAAWESGNWSSGIVWRVVDAQDRVAIGQGNVVGQDMGASKGFGTLAINGSLRAGEHVRLSAGIDNLFDRAYSEHLNLAGSADFGYPAEQVRILEPGRSAWLKLDFSY